MAITVRKLDVADAGMVKSFDCGDADLNEYLRRYAIKNQERHMVGVTYVALSTEHADRVLGYHTIANSSIHRSRMPEELLRGLPKYQDIPAILLGRLAVDKEFAGRGVGHIVISHALDLTLAISHLSGARYIFTDAYDSRVDWYKKYDFRVIPGGSTPMRTKLYLDLRVVKKAREIALKGLFPAAGVQY